MECFLATLFNKLLKSGISPSSWSLARIRLVHKRDSTDIPGNFRPIALTSAVGKLFHKILAARIEQYLLSNSVVDTSVQKGFISNFPGIFEHIFSVSSILEAAFSTKSPLMMTFIDLNNAFGSVPHSYIFDMLRAIQVPASVVAYIRSLYSQLRAVVKCKSWTTSTIPICRGVFQGDTMSPIIFILAFNPLLRLAEVLNHGHGFHFKLMVPNSHNYPPINAYIYIKWLEPNEEQPGWYRAKVIEYFSDGSCTVLYCDTLESTVTETVRLSDVEWVPCYQRSAPFVPISSQPKPVKPRWKKGPFYVNSKEHSMKGYADDATLISTSEEIHCTVLSEVDSKAREIGLLLKPSKCVSVLYDGSKILSHGVSLLGGATKSITEGPTKFLGKLIDVSVHSTKIAAGKAMVDKFTTLISKVDK